MLITLEDHDVDFSPAFTIFLFTREPSVSWELYTAHDRHMHSLYQSGRVMLWTVIASHHRNSVGVAWCRNVTLTNNSLYLIGGFSSAYSSAQVVVLKNVHTIISRK